jgi:type VI secretion system protein VasG
MTNTLLPSISAEFLNRTMAGIAIERVHVSVADGEFCYEFE